MTNEQSRATMKTIIRTTTTVVETITIARDNTMDGEEQNTTTHTPGKVTKTTTTAQDATMPRGEQEGAAMFGDEEWEQDITIDNTMVGEDQNMPEVNRKSPTSLRLNLW